ncbi:MAG: type IV pilus assembly protein PilC [Candidatus Peregrinibacteria bacterium Greene0416_62]|nr:MAG: type IV pilus assembly protein PilC [Candidatus Peregrinibacteria bacterium Greene0416_62]
MVKNKARSGRTPHTFWSRIAGALGLHTKKIVAAKTPIHVARKMKNTRNKKHTKHKKHGRKDAKHWRHPTKKTARHRTHHMSIRKSPTHVGRAVSVASSVRSQTTFHIPRPHLPRILFTEIELPSFTLPKFHRKKQEPRMISAESEAEIPDAAQNIVGIDAPKTDLADLLSGEEATEGIKTKPKKKKVEESTDIVPDLLEKKTEEGKTQSPEGSRKEAINADVLAAAVAAKRKKIQAAEMVIQAPISRGKKVETKAKEKKSEVPEPPTEEQMLQAMEARTKREKKKGITAFFRSLNYMGMGKHCSAFIQNLAMMLNAGLPLIEALQTIQEELRSKAMRTVVQRIADLVEGGNPLWVAMDEQQVFSPYEVSLVRVGEEAGNLARNMEYLAIQQEKDRNLRQKVKMAMIYPTIVLVLMFIVVMGLGIFVLPNLIQVLYALNVELPLSTRIVVAFTEFMQKSGMVTGAAIIGAFITLLILTKYTGFKVITQWFIFRIPGIGSLAKEASIARFGVILGGLLQSGVPLVSALDSMVEVTTVISFKRFYKKLRDRVVVGDSFATCFHTIRGSRKVLPISVQQLIITGEKSGALSDTCLKVAQIYERKAEDTAAKLPVILEPALLLCIGGLVGFIAFSIIVPIYSAVGNVSGG